MLVFVTLLVIHAGFAGTIPAAPENITVTFLNPKSVRVSWQTSLDLQAHPIEKYVVTYKPTDDSYRVVQQVAGNSEAFILDRLSPNTQYQLTVTAVWSGIKYRSRQIIFKTLELPRSSAQQDSGPYIGVSGLPMAPHVGSGHGLSIFPDDVILTSSINATNSTNHRELPPIRGVEVGIVLLVLIVWAGAIALFFNRWGKIRMLLPYQPDYKQEQLKVPGTGVCTGGACNGQHSHQSEGSDPGTINTSNSKIRHFHYQQDEPSTTISERCTRSRINSAIFVSSEGRGFDSIEFLRRHGSQSVLCRKARSAENISDEDRKRRFSENQQWGTEDSSHPSETIEMAECHTIPETPSSIILTTAPTGNNIVQITGIVEPSKLIHSTHSATVTTANSIVGSISIETPPPHIIEIETERNLEQATQNKGSILSQSRSSSIGSQNASPIVLNLKTPRPKLTTLPTLSISGPSPPNEEEFL